MKFFKESTKSPNMSSFSGKITFNYKANRVYSRYMNEMMLKRHILLATALLLSALLLSCSESVTSDETVTFTGTVTLEGKQDHSEVTVSLYKPVELDPSISRTSTALVCINEEYPNIGVQISQETEFDHPFNV